MNEDKANVVIWDVQFSIEMDILSEHLSKSVYCYHHSLILHGFFRRAKFTNNTAAGEEDLNPKLRY